MALNFADFLGRFGGAALGISEQRSVQQRQRQIEDEERARRAQQHAMQQMLLQAQLDDAGIRQGPAPTSAGTVDLGAITGVGPQGAQTNLPGGLRYRDMGGGFHRDMGAPALVQQRAQAALAQMKTRSEIAENEAQASRAMREPTGPLLPWVKEGFPDTPEGKAQYYAHLANTRPPQIGPDRRPEWQKQGYASFPEWREDQKRGGGTGVVTDGERKAASFIPRAQYTARLIDGFEAPGSIISRVSNINELAPEDIQQLNNAARAFITAVLRPESGATINPGEIEETKQIYIPLPGDGPAVLEQKRHLRRLALQQLRTQAGRAHTAEAEPEEAPAMTPNQARTWQMLQAPAEATTQYSPDNPFAPRGR